VTLPHPESANTKLAVPELSLVVLVGASGSGKSTFARTHFSATEVLSSDYCRGLVSDDENDQSATGDAFAILHAIASKRLARGRLTVVDATNIQSEDRRPLVQLARQYHCLPVAIVLNVPAALCRTRNEARGDRNFGAHVVRRQTILLRRSLRELRREGFRNIFVLHSAEEIASVTIERTPLWCDRKNERGPFDLIGDVHGCGDELESLLTLLGYVRQPILDRPSTALLEDHVYQHPEGRKAVFVGDLVDRGPRVVSVLRLVATMVEQGTALCVPGNHDMKLLGKLNGRDVQITHGLAESLRDIDALGEEIKPMFCKEVQSFLDGLVSHYVLDGGKLVVAHAGMKAEYQGRGSGTVREFALYGDTTGETDEFGLPIRYPWAADYRGSACVVYGHTPVPNPEWLNRTINIDTGCVFGGKLTALRYPERELVDVPAQQRYCQPARPFLDPAIPHRASQHVSDDLLDASDVMGKLLIATRFQHNITIREENTAAALEVMSRFAVSPKWLMYLPPTMSPSETSHEPGCLEHPSEAFKYYRSQGVEQVICQEKHMGSRAIVVVCRDRNSAQSRFGIQTGESGIIYTRTGRRFFSNLEVESQLLDRLRTALDAHKFWDTFDSNWACFDCELMPWSAKAQELLRSQYAAVGAAGNAGLHAVMQSIHQATDRIDGEHLARIESLRGRFQNKQAAVADFASAYRRYCWNVSSVSDLKLAPFHLLATEGKAHLDRTHAWHMEQLAHVCQHDPEVLMQTRNRTVDTKDPESVDAACQWWSELTQNGGEGMVVKPMEWIVRTQQGIVQPAIKCRGKEYLRIIYGPEYDSPENIDRLRQRGLGRKRSLAIREFTLGLEALMRFVEREPLRRVHECVFGVLALESEPVDPRL
jgi:protein phosphatase